MGSARGLPPSKLADLEDALDRLVSAVIARIAGAVARVIRGAPNSAAVDPVDDAAIVLPLWATAATAELTPAVAAVWMASAAQVAEEFTAAGLSTSPLGPDQAAAYLAQASNRLVGIGDIVWQQVASELAVGVEAGESIPELAARVRVAAGVSEQRATVIARTEVLSAANHASFTQARALDDPTTKKIWAAVPDDRTRLSHREADGQTVPLMQPFMVGGTTSFDGFPLMFPGDPSGPPSETANCRCTLLYRFDDGVVTAAVDGWDVTIVATGDRDYVRDNHGRFAETSGEKLVSALKDAVTSTDDSSGTYFDDGRYIDMSSVRETADDTIMTLEIGDGEDTLQIDVDSNEAQQLLAAASGTLLAAADPDVSTSQGRLQALLSRATKGAYFPNDRYFDWSSRDENGSYRFEVGDGDGTVSMTLSPAEFERWVLSLGDAMIRGGAMTAAALVAAAEVHTGAMIALAPSTEDAYRLEVGDGEPAEQLHSTLAYLGDDADLSAEQRLQILGLASVLAGRGALELDAFGVSIFNPTSDEHDTAIVLPLGGKEGPEWSKLREAAVAGARAILGEILPDQHEPPTPHVTLAYTDDLSMAAEWTDRTGPILFDHIRVAFGEDVYDIPMSSCDCGGPMVAAADNNPEFNRKHHRGPGGRFKTMGERVSDAIDAGDGLDGFDRPQLLKAGKQKGLTFKRGAPVDDIKKALIDAYGGKTPEAEAPKPVKAVKKAAKKRAPDKKTAAPVPTWEELGKPLGPPPVGVPIGHEGGTYELLPGEPRRYRVTSEDGKDLSDRVRTAEDARTALRMDALDRQRIRQAHDSGAVDVWDSIPGSWSYENGQIKGFRGATAAQKRDIRTALSRWTGHKSTVDDASRQAEPTVNAVLRGAVPMTADVQADIGALDLALSLSRTKKPITVYRGVTNGEHILPDDWQDTDLTGLEWSTDGYTPTTGNSEGAEGYVGLEENRGFMMRLHLPKGASAVAIRDAIGGLDDEGEVILPRGLTFRVVGDNGVQGELGLRQLDVEVSETKPEAVKPVVKAGPDPAAEVARINGDGWRQGAAARREAVAATAKTPIKEDRPLGGGMMGVVNLQTHDDGTMLVSKNGSKGASIRDPESQADAEELAALVAPALGVRAPAVVRTSEDEILMEHIDGEDGTEIVPWGTGLSDTPEGLALIDSDQGRLLGLMDLIIANSDRNNGNWIVTPQEDLVAIDHGMAFQGPVQDVEIRAVYDEDSQNELYTFFIDGQRVPNAPTFEEYGDAIEGAATFEGDGSDLQTGDLLELVAGNHFAAPFMNETQDDFGPNDMSPEDMATMRARLGGLWPEFQRIGRSQWFFAMMERFDWIAANATGTGSRLS